MQCINVNIFQFFQLINKCILMNHQCKILVFQHCLLDYFLNYLSVQFIEIQLLIN